MPTACFLNVDLELEAAEDLSPLVARRPATTKLIRIASTEVPGGYLATFELGRRYPSADLTVRAVVSALTRLPEEVRREIRGKAKRFDLCIGIQAEAEPRTFEIALSPRTLRAAAEIGARITVCVYAPPIGESSVGPSRG